ncbi:ABC transporter substrate-binding protein [Streptomyces sp. NBC_00268]|uniref:ABC transporter substrate-binding protein n=1 Tax=Streptomyces sp. NBC_00268 TaxID=2975695 RepID=UPI002254B6FA|nr:ABC transporter substrate-binding protein [Streptomyces sp. NBC_00268]MCX5188910.1 ABC transporter substrate-binding protein [Streptomyces sp. NBC_00268]
MKTFPARSRRTAHAVVGGTLLLSLTATACVGGETSSNRPSAKLSDKDIPAFTFALYSQPPGYDKATSTQPVTTGSFMSLVTEPLERTSPTGTFTPALAEKVTQPDPKSIVYQLRSGLKFSNGAPLTAEDVAWSITHTGTPPAQTSTSVQGFKSAKVTGDLEVTVKLKAAVPGSRARLASTVLVQEKKFALANKSKLGTSDAIPVGTGPYKITSASASGVTLVRQSAYWGTMPKAKKINIEVIPDDNSAQLAMRSGEIDLRQLTNVKAAPQWRAVPGTTVYSGPSTALNFLTMDVTKAPFDDVHVRRAIAHTVDVPGLIKGAWGGEATRHRGFVPAQNVARVAGGKNNAQKFLDTLPTYDFDLKKAKTQLSRSKHADGFSTTIKYLDSMPATKVLALSLQQNLKTLGVDAQVKSTTLNAWSADFFQHKLTGLNLAFGFTASTYDPSSMLGQVVGKENIGPQKLNIANFTTPEVEMALPIVRSAGPNAPRWKASQTLLTQIAEQAPYVPLPSEKFVMAMGKGFASSTGKITTEDYFNGSWALNLRATQAQ